MALVGKLYLRIRVHLYNRQLAAGNRKLWNKPIIDFGQHDVFLGNLLRPWSKRILYGCTECYSHVPNTKRHLPGHCAHGERCHQAVLHSLHLLSQFSRRRTIPLCLLVALPDEDYYWF